MKCSQERARAPPITANEDHSVKISPARSCLAAQYGLGCDGRFGVLRH
jgi:hypothetical protein